MINSIMPVYKRKSMIFEYGKGSYVYDNMGVSYLDFGSGIAVNCLGHVHPRLVNALQEQSKKLWHVSNLYLTDKLIQVSERYVRDTFADTIFFCNSGAESLECAIKMTRKYHYNKGNTNKNRIITFSSAFHGRTMAALSASNRKGIDEGFHPMLDGFRCCGV